MTIRDLAKKLNLSITTVSRALDGYSDVAEETRLRVMKAADEMGYQPSYAARQLRRQRADAIGYILPSTVLQFSDPFAVNFLTGLCDEAASLCLDMVVTSSPPDSPEEQSQYRRWAQSRRVDGVILNRTRVYDWRMEFLAANNLPFVSLGRGDYQAGYPYIDILDTRAVQNLVAFLVDKGHRRIAFIGASPDLVIHVDRLAGYRQGLASAGLPLDPGLVQEGDLSEEGGYRAAQVLLGQAKPPSAIVGCNDLTALGALRAAKERGLKVGSDLALAGYDGIKETETADPPLTTIHQPTYEIARDLIRLLVGLLEGGRPAEDHRTIEPQLVRRASTG